MKRTVIIHALLPVFKTIKNKNHKIYIELECGNQKLYTTTFPYKKEMWFNQKFDFDISDGAEITARVYAIELPEKDENNKEIVRSQSTVKFTRPDGIPPSNGLDAVDGGEKGLLIATCKIDSSLKYIEKRLEIRASRNTPAPLHPADQENKLKPGWKRPVDYAPPKPRKTAKETKPKQSDEEKIAKKRQEKMESAKERELDVKYHMFTGKLLVSINAPKLEKTTKTKLDRTQECFEKNQINADVAQIVEEADGYAEKKYEDFIQKEFKFFVVNHKNMQKIRDDNEKYREAKAHAEAERNAMREEEDEKSSDSIDVSDDKNSEEDNQLKAKGEFEELAQSETKEEENVAVNGEEANEKI